MPTNRLAHRGAAGEGFDLTGVLAAWLLGFGLVLFVAFSGGGYDLLVRGQVGIAVWWVAILGVLVGAWPRRRPGRLVVVALAIFLGLVVWVAASLIWTESSERTSYEVSRVAILLGVFVLALLTRSSHSARHMVTAIGFAIAIVAAVALATRLHPGWIEAAGETAGFLEGARGRLGYPLNYWNALGALIAMGLPLVLYIATSVRRIEVRALAAASVPLMIGALYFSFSRSGIGAAVVAVLLFLAFSGDRIATLGALLTTGVGSAVVLIVASGKQQLQDGATGPVAQSQGDELTLIVVLVCVVTGLVHAALSHFLGTHEFPKFLSPTPRQAGVGVAVIAVVAVVVGLAAGGGQSASEAWDEFKLSENPGAGSSRLGSASGNGRYQYWMSAVDQFESKPVLGTGGGTFEYWWSRNSTLSGAVRDTHSLYFQTLGELGLPGLLLIVAFLVTVLGGGYYRWRHAATGRRNQIAAPLAGCAAFCVAAGFDWVWQVTVLPMVFMLLAAVMLTSGGSKPIGSIPWPYRGGFAAIGLVALVAISIPMASTALVRESQQRMSDGDPVGALDSARSAARVQPGASSPHLQAALVLEAEGDLEAALSAASEATRAEPTNWRPWLVRSRINAGLGRAEPSIEALRKARALNPEHSLFDP